MITDDFVVRARELGFAVQQLDADLLVYDRKRDVAHSLTGAAATAWVLTLDGHADPDALSGLLDVSVQEATDLQAELAALGLLPAAKAGHGYSRRDLASKFAVAAAATPLILSVAAPRADASLSKRPSGAICSGNGNCTSGTCNEQSCVVPVAGQKCCA